MVAHVGIGFRRLMARRAPGCSAVALDGRVRGRGQLGERGGDHEVVQVVSASAIVLSAREIPGDAAKRDAQRAQRTVDGRQLLFGVDGRLAAAAGLATHGVEIAGNDDIAVGDERLQAVEGIGQMGQ